MRLVTISLLAYTVLVRLPGTLRAARIIKEI